MSNNEQRSRPKETVPTDRLSFENQIDLLRAYAAASQDGDYPVSNADVAEIVGINASTASLANAFFSDVGFIKKHDGGYLPAQEVIEFNNAFHWDQETAPHKLAPLLEKTWFALAIEPKLRFGEIAIDEAIKTLANASSASPKYKSRLETLLSYLEISGIIELDGNIIRKSSPSLHLPEQKVLDKRLTEQRDSKKESVRMSSAHISSGVHLSFNIQVDMNEFAGWEADRIKAFFNGIAQVLAAKAGTEKENNY